MNKEWAELNKKFQTLISKKQTFEEGKKVLLELRKSLYDTVIEEIEELNDAAFYQQPFVGKDGYDSKTIAYSIYHISRIEDIVLCDLLKSTKEVFFEKDYQNKMKSSIITTGNELKDEEIEEFSKALNINELIQYFKDVYNISNDYIKELSFDSLKIKIDESKKKVLYDLGVVSHDESAIWLIDYWCDKNTLGLLKMPFSRHWIMHIEALIRIKNKL